MGFGDEWFNSVFLSESESLSFWASFWEICLLFFWMLVARSLFQRARVFLWDRCVCYVSECVQRGEFCESIFSRKFSGMSLRRETLKKFHIALENMHNSSQSCEILEPWKFLKLQIGQQRPGESRQPVLQLLHDAVAKHFSILELMYAVEDLNPQVDVLFLFST